jgi:predicted DNA-binding transcriptional regulator YafY
MAPKRNSGSRIAAGAVTAERAARLGRLVQLLASGPQPRDALMRRLRLDIRSFYRDLEVLRGCGIHVPLHGGRYALKQKLEQAIGRLPFPDPHLNLAEATQLAKGATPAHAKLRRLVQRIRPAARFQK